MTPIILTALLVFAYLALLSGKMRSGSPVSRTHMRENGQATLGDLGDLVSAVESDSNIREVRMSCSRRRSVSLANHKGGYAIMLRFREMKGTTMDLDLYRDLAEELGIRKPFEARSRLFKSRVEPARMLVLYPRTRDAGVIEDMLRRFLALQGAEEGIPIFMSFYLRRPVAASIEASA